MCLKYQWNININKRRVHLFYIGGIDVQYISFYDFYYKQMENMYNRGTFNRADWQLLELTKNSSPFGYGKAASSEISPT